MLEDGAGSVISGIGAEPIEEEENIDPGRFFEAGPREISEGIAKFGVWRWKGSFD